ARLWSDDAPGSATPAGHLVTRECVHWDTVGPHSSPHHVNPQARVQWRVHLDGTDAADDGYCDDPGAPVLAVGDATEIVVRGRHGARGRRLLGPPGGAGPGGRRRDGDGRAGATPAGRVARRRRRGGRVGAARLVTWAGPRGRDARVRGRRRPAPGRGAGRGRRGGGAGNRTPVR